MGKRGKSARKRRRENEVSSTAFTAASPSPKQLKTTNGVPPHTSGSDDVSDADLEVGMHDIPDVDLDITISTLRKLCGLTDELSGKLALKDKRYRALRRVLYELQSDTSGGGTGSTTVVSLLSSDKSVNTPQPISASKITNEISQQIENGAWDLAISSLRTLRKKQEEASSIASSSNSLACYRPKLGALQRWVRQVDAAGTTDPLALEVLDAILRVVAPEAIMAINIDDTKEARWATLGVHKEMKEIVNDGGGKILLFPAFNCQANGNNDTSGGGNSPELMSTTEATHDKNDLDSLVAAMKRGDDGIRRIYIADLKNYRDRLFRTCGKEDAKARLPPNRYDLEIVTTAIEHEHQHIQHNNLNATMVGGEVLLSGNISYKPVIKRPLPYVHNSFLLENVLSPEECARMIAAAETAGYYPDEPLAGQPGESILAHACVWMVDYQLERTIFDRVKKFLPSYTQSMQADGSGDSETFVPLGLNRRFRFYRYIPGRYYRPHIDGAWPASGFDVVTGDYRYDVFDKDNKNGLQFVENAEGSEGVIRFYEKERATKHPKDKKDDKKRDDVATAFDSGRRQLSRLTFLVYLNDDFEGGHTTFLIPAKEKDGVLNAFPVKPIRGGILVFPHGTCGESSP